MWQPWSSIGGSAQSVYHFHFNLDKPTRETYLLPQLDNTSPQCGTYDYVWNDQIRTQICRPFLAELARQSGETAQLFLLSGDDASWPRWPKVQTSCASDPTRSSVFPCTVAVERRRSSPFNPRKNGMPTSGETACKTIRPIPYSTGVQNRGTPQTEAFRSASAMRSAQVNGKPEE